MTGRLFVATAAVICALGALGARDAFAEACGEVTAAGCCDRETLEFCRSDGTLAKVNCAGTAEGSCRWAYAGHSSCGYNGDGTTTSEDPTGVNPPACPKPAGACLPDCRGKECGADGCGGSCGTCASGSYCGSTLVGYVGGTHAVAIDANDAGVEFGPTGWAGTWLQRPTSITTLSAVAAYRYNFIGLYGGGKVVVWGGIDPSIQPTIADPITDAVAVAAGNDFLVLHRDGTVSQFSPYPDRGADVGKFAIDIPSFNQLWDSAHNRFKTYVEAVPGITGATAIAANYSHYVAIKADGKAADWGSTWAYMDASPQDIGQNIAALAAGYDYTLALLKSGALRVWDDGSHNAVANRVFTGMPTTHDFVGVAAGGSGEAAALRSNGTVVVWGSNDGNIQSIPAGLGFVTSLAIGETVSSSLIVAVTKCASVCTPSCDANVCQTNGCGGPCPTCGGCDPSRQSCPCIAQCTGKNCGPDHCGGTRESKEPRHG